MVFRTDHILNGWDELNKRNSRNINNTERFAYNCGGYALGTFSWYCPYREDDAGFWYFEEYDDDAIKEMATLTEELTKVMLEDFPDMRVIESISDLELTEYAIAFRISSDGDFHYIRRTSSGRWLHKMGASYSIDTMKKTEVFSGCWLDRYDGPLVLFAKKR